MQTEDSPRSLLDLARDRKTIKGSKCSIGKLLLSADPSLDLPALLDNSGDGRGEGIPYAVAASVLSEAIGQKVDGQTISRHNRRRCACS